MRIYEKVKTSGEFYESQIELQRWFTERGYAIVAMKINFDEDFDLRLVKSGQLFRAKIWSGVENEDGAYTDDIEIWDGEAFEYGDDFLDLADEWV